MDLKHSEIFTIVLGNNKYERKKGLTFSER